MAVKGTWTTGSPPNHLPTILGALAIVLLIVVGLFSRSEVTIKVAPVPTASPSPTVSATHAAGAPGQTH